MELKPDFEFVADTVMGGVSIGEVTQALYKDRDSTRLTGGVSLANNGGFIQMAFDLDNGAVVDASGFRGVELEVCGNGAHYELRLRTDQLTRPWQSFRASFDALPDWQVLRFAWDDFEGRKTDAVLDPARLRRIGVLAIGAEMRADVAVAAIRFYR